MTPICSFPWDSFQATLSTQQKVLLPALARVLTASPRLVADSCHQQQPDRQMWHFTHQSRSRPREEEAPQLQHNTAASPFLPLTASSISQEHTNLTSHQTLRPSLYACSNHSHSRLWQHYAELALYAVTWSLEPS